MTSGIIEPVTQSPATDEYLLTEAKEAGVVSQFLSLWALRQLIGIMVQRDLLGRYKGSLMGAFWPVINPLGHLLLYTFVFSIILKVRFGTDPGTSNFALYLMSGLVPWGAFSETIARSTKAILEAPNLVKRVVFPLETLPLVIVFSSLAGQAISIVLLIGFAWFHLHTVHTTVLFLPLIMFSQVLFTAGIAWLVAALGVYVRDLGHAISLALSVWMYSTPIVYPASCLPSNLEFLLWINPIAGIVGDYRRVVLEGQAPLWSSYCTYTLVGLLCFWVGFYFFHKARRSFADVI